MKALAEVPSVGYKHLSHYIQKIGEITFQLMDTEDYECTKLVLQFWINTCKEEQSRVGPENLGLILSCYPSLITIIEKGLITQQIDVEDKDLKETEDVDDWTVERASA